MRRYILFMVSILMGFPAAVRGQTGEQPVVEVLTFQGNRKVSTGELKLLMYTRASPWYALLPGAAPRRLDPMVFRSDVARIVSHYRDLGYFNAVVDTAFQLTAPGRVWVRVRISEGDPVRVAQRRITGLPQSAELDTVRLWKNLRNKPERPLVRADLVADRDLILGALQNAGYALAKVAMDVDMTPETHRADVAFRTQPGPRCRIGRILVTGNKKVSEGVILRGLSFRSGDTYQRRELRDSQRQLYRSGTFRSVSLGLPDSVARTSPVDVVVSVRERAPRSVELRTAYDTEEQLRVAPAWRHRNFLGGARQLRVEAEASAVRMGVEAELRQPYILGSRTWLSTSAYAKQDRPEEVRVKRLGGRAALERTFRATGRVIFEVNTDLVDFKPDSTRATFGITYQEDTRDDFFDPQKGLLALVSLRETGVVFMSDREFLKLTGEGRWYRKLPWRNVLAFRVSGGVLWELGKTHGVLRFDRFFAGGASSVRGWGYLDLTPRDAAGVKLGGLSKLEGSIEIRTRLLPFLGTALFLDVGSVGEDQMEVLDLSLLRWSAGFGVRYLSPIGPIRVDVAYRLSADPFVSGRRRMYFSLGQAF